MLRSFNLTNFNYIQLNYQKPVRKQSANVLADKLYEHVPGKYSGGAVRPLILHLMMPPSSFFSLIDP